MVRGSRFTLPGVLLLAALGLRLIRLGFQPLWWDEGWSVFFATADVGTLLRLTAVDIHPPFYYLVLKLWIAVLGPTPQALRLLSVLLGTLSVPLLYATGRRLFGDRVGLLAALLLALSPLHVYYSQEVRMYGLVTLLCLAALYCALQTESHPWGRGAWLGYVVAATAALHTQYYAAFLLLALNLAVLGRWLWQRRELRRLVPWMSAQIATALLFLPWLWYAGDRLRTYVRYKVEVESDAPRSLLAYVGQHLSAFHWGHLEGALSNWWWVGLVPLLVFVLWAGVSLLGRARRARSGSQVAQAWIWPSAIVLIVFASGFVINRILPFYPPRGERLLLLALPAYLLLLSLALWRLWDDRYVLFTFSLGGLVALSLVSLIHFYLIPRYPADDYRPVAARLETLALSSDVVVCVHPWQVGYFRAYLPDQAQRPRILLTPREVLPRERQLWADEPARMADELDTLLGQHRRLWLPAHQAMGRVLEEQMQALLIEQAYPVLTEWHGDNTVLFLYADGEPLAQPAHARFGDSLALAGASLNTEPLQSAWGVVTVELSWQLLKPVSETLQVGLRLTDATGHVWAQRDSVPAVGWEASSDWASNELYLDRHGVLVPAGTPPGQYRVTLQVYRKADLAVLPASFPDGSGGEVLLGRIDVVRPQVPPPLEAVDVAQSLGLDFGGRLELLGYTLTSPPVRRQGEAVNLELAWHTLDELGEDLLPRLQLIDSGGASVAELTEKPVMGRYPTAWWQPGELVRDPHSLLIPATAPAGQYRLTMELVRALDGTAVPFRPGRSRVDLGRIEVQEIERQYEPPTPTYGQLERMGSAVEFLGYDLRKAVRAPGSPLEVTLHWHALETPDRNYHAFVHLLNAEGDILAQHDGLPQGGERPPYGWLPAEYIADSHRLHLPVTLDDGDYRLAVGLYDPITAQRLGERLILDSRIPVSAEDGCHCP
jgi:4-amino-4-deoxy-L-arabinose transferase-like glycosyltransferase